MKKYSIGFKLEMIESKTHLLWACHMQSKEVSHLMETGGMTVICEDRVWTVSSFPPAAS